MKPTLWNLPALLICCVIPQQVAAQVAPLPSLPPPAASESAATPQALPIAPLQETRGPSASGINAPQPQAAAPIVGLPEVKTDIQPASSPLIEGLAMPGVIVPLMAERFLDIPDDPDVRRYVFSVYSGISSVCGEPSTDMALAATGYVEPRLAPGRDVAEFGMNIFKQMLLNYGNAVRTGDISSVVGAGSVDGYKVKHGLSEGATLAYRLGCGTSEFRTFNASLEKMIRKRSGTNPSDADSLRYASLMSLEYRRLNGIADPGPAMKKRRIDSSAKLARGSCAAKYDPPAFCDCVMDRLKGNDLPETDWQTIESDFSGIVALASRNAAVAQGVRSCIRGS